VPFAAQYLSSSAPAQGRLRRRTDGLDQSIFMPNFLICADQRAPSRRKIR